MTAVVMDPVVPWEGAGIDAAVPQAIMDLNATVSLFKTINPENTSPYHEASQYCKQSIVGIEGI